MYRFKWNNFLSFLILVLVTFANDFDGGISNFRGGRAALGSAGFTGNDLSPLLSVTTNLSHLTRIINVMSLQNLAIEKTITIREVGAELLGTRIEEFSDLLMANVTIIQSIIRQMFDPAVAIRQTRIDNLDGKKAALKFLTDSIADLGKLTEARNFTMNTVFKLINDQKTNYTWQLCPAAGNLVQFFEALSNETTKTDQWRESVLRSTLNQNASDGFLQCHQSLSEFIGRLENYTRETLRAIDQLYLASNFLEDYQSRFPILTRLPQAFGRLNTEISNSSGFRNLLKAKVAGNLELLVKAYLDGIHHSSYQPPIYTAALPNGYPDIVEIFSNDLSSPWFREQVAGGNATIVETVARKLEAIGNLSLEMRNVHGSWEVLAEKNVSMVLHFGQQLERLEEYKFDEQLGESLGNYSKNFEECFNRTSLNVSTVYNSSEFRRVNWQLFSISEALKELLNLTKTRNSSSSIPSDDWKLEEFLSDLKDMVLSADLHTNIATIRAIPNFATFQRLGAFHKKEQELQMQIRNDLPFIDTTGIPDYTKIQNGLELVDVISCFARTTFDGQRMQDAVDFLDVAYRFSARTAEKDHVLEYLSAAQQVQMDQAAFEKAIRKSTPKLDPFPLKNHVAISQSLGFAVRMLEEMDAALVEKSTIEDVMQFNQSINDQIVQLAEQTADANMVIAFKNPRKIFGDMLESLEKLSAFASATAPNSLPDCVSIFENASRIRGFAGKHVAMNAIAAELERKGLNDEAAAIKNVSLLELDFARAQFDSAATHLTEVRRFFEAMFGVKRMEEGEGWDIEKEKIIIVEPAISNLVVVAICCGSFACYICLVFIVYGFTKDGRRKLKNLYYYYTQNHKEFEKRWRYSLFMDRVDGSNALLDAAREMNDMNVKEALDKGAYINAYNFFGNTSLHLSTKLGMVRNVDQLIRNGADRMLLNCENKTPEEMIPRNYKEKRKEAAHKFEAIEAIYRRYRNRKFRIRVPMTFPPHRFHIFAESATDNALTVAFTERFPGIIAEELYPTTTHIICKVNEQGHLETADIELLQWILYGAIFVKEAWMTDCLKDESTIRRDCDYLIRSVVYKGKLLENCIVPWTEARAKGAMPFLLGVTVIYCCATQKMNGVGGGPDELRIFHTLIENLGGTAALQWVNTDVWNPGFRPYLHSNRGPLFLVHDDSLADIELYKDNKLFTFITVDAFVEFLLTRETQRNEMKPVIPQTGQVEQ